MYAESCGILQLAGRGFYGSAFYKPTNCAAQICQRTLENSGESVKTCISLDAQFLTAAAILPRFLSPTFRETRYGLGCQLRMLLAVLDHGSGREANQSHVKIGIEESQPSFAVPLSPRL